ncbi:MAG: hypothetical protein KDK38_12635 [Leptospiraceae bacterium]|nr:hypothetical protein [Leptospiraceae bacterium]
MIKQKDKIHWRKYWRENWASLSEQEIESCRKEILGQFGESGETFWQELQELSQETKLSEHPTMENLSNSAKEIGVSVLEGTARGLNKLSNWLKK